MIQRNCEAGPYQAAKMHFTEGLATWKEKKVEATNIFLIGAPIAEDAVSIPSLPLDQKAELIEMAATMHLMAGNYDRVLTIGQNSLKGMERFPERKARITTLMERAQDPERCEKIYFACQPIS